MEPQNALVKYSLGIMIFLPLITSGCTIIYYAEHVRENPKYQIQIHNDLPIIVLVSPSRYHVCAKEITEKQTQDGFFDVFVNNNPSVGNINLSTNNFVAQACTANSDQTKINGCNYSTIDATCILSYQSDKAISVKVNDYTKTLEILPPKKKNLLAAIALPFIFTFDVVVTAPIAFISFLFHSGP